MATKLASRAFVVALLAACVPTEPERDPRGGLSVTFPPSEATAGAPFTTRDGWTVTLEKTAIRVSAIAQAVPDENGITFPSGSSAMRIIDPRYACEVRVSELYPGPVLVAVQLQQVDPRYDYGQNSDACAVDAATRDRFKTYADEVVRTPELDDPYSYVYANAPSVYVKGSARKDARTVSFELALGAIVGGFGGDYDEDGVYHSSELLKDNVVKVVQNQGVPIRFEVHFESMFANGVDALANADADRDGKVTSAELRAVPLPCASTYPGSSSSSGYPGYPGNSGNPGNPGNPGYPGDDDDDSGTTDGSYCPTLLDQFINQASTVLSLTPSKR